MMEIEVRAFIGSANEFKKRLRKLGAKFKAKQRIIDYYFCNRSKTSFKQVCQHKAGSHSLRIRKIIENGRETAELNCKTLERTGDHQSFNEYETKVGDFNQARLILEKSGLKVFCKIDKIREVYKLGNCAINIEDIKGYKPAVELEILSNKNIEARKAAMNALLNKLGIDEKNKIATSITNVYMNTFAFKQHC